MTHVVAEDLRKLDTKIEYKKSNEIELDLVNSKIGFKSDTKKSGSD
jgi:hypothetical protein